jgi:hypothetical protein
MRRQKISTTKKLKWRQNIVGKTGRAKMGMPFRSFNLPPVRIVGPTTSTRKQPRKGCRCCSLAARPPPSPRIRSRVESATAGVRTAGTAAGARCTTTRLPAATPVWRTSTSASPCLRYVLFDHSLASCMRFDSSSSRRAFRSLLVRSDDGRWLYWWRSNNYARAAESWNNCKIKIIYSALTVLCVVQYDRVVQ